MAINRDELEEMRSCFKTCEIVNRRKGHFEASILYQKAEKYLRILLGVEEIAREAFEDAEIDLQDGNYNKMRDCYRKAQALANIHALFVYDGKTLKGEVENGD